MSEDFKYNIGDYVYSMLPVLCGDPIEVNGVVKERYVDEYGNRFYTVDCGTIDGVMRFYERNIELDNWYY